MSDLLTKELVHPITGEVLAADDLAAIKAALKDTEDYIRRPEVRKMYDARDALQARRGELEPLAVPPVRNQTDRQQRVTRCPNCKTVIPRALGEGAGPGTEDAAASPDSRETDPSPSPSAQAELLPRGQRTSEQEEALGVDIFGEPKTDATPQSASVVDDQPSLTTPEREAESREDAASPSPLSDPVVLAGQEVFQGGKHKDRSVAWVCEIDPDYLAYTLTVSKNERLKAAITTFLAAAKTEGAPCGRASSVLTDKEEGK